MKFLIVILFTFSCFFCGAQLSDSLVQADSIQRVPDSLSAPVIVMDTISQDSVRRVNFRVQAEANFLRKIDTAIYGTNPFFRFTNPVKMFADQRQWKGKEGFFYSIVALLLFFAFAKNSFSRYLDDLFRTFFRTTLKQRQTRDQLMNAPLPSLFFNILYTLSAALFITLLFHHFKIGMNYSFLVLFLYCLAGLLVIYTVKFLSLKLCGWVLGVTEATNAYIFIVFTTNKVIGILLLPFIIGLAFMERQMYEVVFTLCICMLSILFVYRFYLSFISVQKLVHINFFHFVLYLAAFEIAPLLLINKVLLGFFS